MNAQCHTYDAPIDGLSAKTLAVFDSKVTDQSKSSSKYNDEKVTLLVIYDSAGTQPG